MHFQLQRSISNTKQWNRTFSSFPWSYPILILKKTIYFNLTKILIRIIYSYYRLHNFHSISLLKMQPLLERNPGADQQHTTLPQHSSQQEINTLDIIKKISPTNWRDSMSSSLKNTRGFKSIPRKIKVYFIIYGSKPATLHDLCSASNSIYMRLKILVHVLPLNVHKQLPLKSMAAASAQPRAEFSLMYRSLSERLSALSKTRRVLKPLNKVFLSRKTETSPKSAELTF